MKVLTFLVKTPGASAQITVQTHVNIVPALTPQPEPKLQTLTGSAAAHRLDGAAVETFRTAQGLEAQLKPHVLQYGREAAEEGNPWGDQDISWGVDKRLGAPQIPQPSFFRF